MIELNITGTLPDEVDELATVNELNALKLIFSGLLMNMLWLYFFFFKCFIRCYLEKQEILKNDILDRERGMELELARNEDILDDCSKEARGEREGIKRCIGLSFKLFCLFHCHRI